MLEECLFSIVVIGNGIVKNGMREEGGFGWDKVIVMGLQIFSFEPDLLY